MLSFVFELKKPFMNMEVYGFENSKTLNELINDQMEVDALAKHEGLICNQNQKKKRKGMVDRRVNRSCETFIPMS